MCLSCTSWFFLSGERNGYLKMLASSQYSGKAGEEIVETAEKYPHYQLLKRYSHEFC